MIQLDAKGTLLMFESRMFWIRSHITCCVLLALILGCDHLIVVDNAVILLFVSWFQGGAGVHLWSRRVWPAGSQLHPEWTPASCGGWAVGSKGYTHCLWQVGSANDLSSKVKALRESLKNSREGSHQDVQITVSQYTVRVSVYCSSISHPPARAPVRAEPSVPGEKWERAAKTTRSPWSFSLLINKVLHVYWVPKGKGLSKACIRKVTEFPSRWQTGRFKQELKSSDDYSSLCPSGTGPEKVSW